jgi:hypothetical protein
MWPISLHDYDPSINTGAETKKSSISILNKIRRNVIKMLFILIIIHRLKHFTVIYIDVCLKINWLHTEEFQGEKKMQ